MNERCCCGCCSLTAGCGVALVLASIEAIVGILVHAELLLLISESDFTNPLRFVVNIDAVEDFDVFHGIVLAALGLHTFWLAFAIFAAIGNISQSHARLTPWTFITYLLSLFQFGVSVYLAIKFQASYTETQEFYQDSIPTKTLTYLTLLGIYSGGGILIFFNLFLAHVVERRGKEIDNDYSALVLYILSHMSRCSHMNDSMQQNLLPEAPPSYDAECPRYIPPRIYPRTNDSSGSSWSQSVDFLKEFGQSNASTDINNMRRNIATNGQIEFFTNRNARPGYQTVNVDTSNSAAFPY